MTKPESSPSRLPDYVTLHNIALVTLSITAAALFGRGAARRAIEITTDMQQDIQAFRSSFFMNLHAASAEGALSDFKMPIILRYPVLERPIAMYLSSFNHTRKIELGDLLRHYGVSSATARPMRESIGSMEQDQLWIRMLTNPKPQTGERKHHYEIVGAGCLYDAPSQPFPIRGGL